jgi:NAD(P)H-dependent FMN reductase
LPFAIGLPRFGGMPDPEPLKRLLIINGALRGAGGNTARVLAGARTRFASELDVRDLVLAEYTGTVEAMAHELQQADAFLFATGVYWGSWGSPMQRFLEVMTWLEGSDALVGKPAGVVVTMDSVGGQDVAQRLLAVLATLGCLVPPMPMVVVSRLSTAVEGAPGNEDVWRVDDIHGLVENLRIAGAARSLPWRSWAFERTVAPSGPYPAAGPLDLGLPSFGGGPGSQGA